LSRGEADAAVGLRFTGDALPGLIPGVEDALPAVTVERADARVLDERWAEGAEPELIFERPFPDGRPFLHVERDAGAGYRVSAVEHGIHLLAPGGEHCASALPDGPVWRGLKLLAAQVLPLLATLRGREVLHAAGVVVDERLIGIVAPSGTGKSATACNVIAQGGRFFADDVLALELLDGRVWAHPGTRLLNVYPQDLEAIADAGRARLGEPLGTSDKAHFAPEGFPGALPLRGLLFLRRSGQAETSAPRPVAHPSARLLGNAFLPYLDRPERLALQLEVMSALSRTVPLAELDIAPGDRPPELAGVVNEWARTLP
jgi:hypothetical protein